MRHVRAYLVPLGFALCLISYWAPWVAHKDAGLAIAEVDLVEFPKFMPQFRAGDLAVWREAFYVPLLVLIIALVILAVTVRPAWLRWLLRLVALVLPPTPSIFNVLESHELKSQLNMVAIALVLILLTPILRRLSGRALRALLLVAFILGALIPSVQFFWLAPALAEIYREPIAVGWGLWANVVGFALLALSQLSWRPSHDAKICEERS
jgi:hypothetical protein